MRKLDITVGEADLSLTATDGVLIDKETGYPIQLWEQKVLGGGIGRYLVLYLRKGKWHRGSPQMLDRILRANGYPPLTACPWGAGREMLMAVDDMIEAGAGPAAMSSALRKNAPVGD